MAESNRALEFVLLLDWAFMAAVAGCCGRLALPMAAAEDVPCWAFNAAVAKLMEAW